MEDRNDQLDSIKTDLLGLLGGAGIGSTLSSDGSKAAIKLINRYTDQKYPIGELFMSYAPSVAGLSSGGESMSYIQAYPRVFSDLDVSGGKGLRGALLDMSMPSVASDTKYSINLDDALKYPEQAKEALNRVTFPAMAEEITHEVIGDLPPDKFIKNPEFLEKLRSIKSDVEIPEIIKSLADKELALDGVHTKHMLKVPRNNTLTMAHEIGHVLEAIEREKSLHTGSPLWQSIKKGINTLYEEGGVRGIRDSKFSPDFIKKPINNFINGIKSPVLNSVATSIARGFGTPLTAMVAPFTMSQTIRDLVSSLDSSGNTKKVMDWVGDNATTVSALASSPLIIHEIATTAPGYKMTVDFWKEFNKGFNGALKDSPLLRESAMLIGKKKPWLEGLKFLGQNALRFVPAFAPVIATAISSAINKSRKEDDSL